jgi:hypothetical protein
MARFHISDRINLLTVSGSIRDERPFSIRIYNPIDIFSLLTL